MRNYNIATAVLAGGYISQAVFYSGEWPTEMRYDFLGVLAIPFFYFFTLLTGFRIGALLQIPKKILHGMLGYAIVALYLLSPYKVDELAKSRQHSIENAERTTAFQSDLRELISQIIDKPGMPLIFESFHWLDYEPIFSLREYLYTYGVRQNPLYLYIHPYPEEIFDRPSAKYLANNLRLLHKYGGEGFLPLRRFPKATERCFAITFSGDTQTSCNSFKIWTVEELRAKKATM
ncbi:MAG: hypothetical protein GY801_16890 [bacterium]|nr:hypothetical protein [bacterium]